MVVLLDTHLKSPVQPVPHISPDFGTVGITSLLAHWCEGTLKDMQDLRFSP